MRDSQTTVQALAIEFSWHTKTYVEARIADTRGKHVREYPLKSACDGKIRKK